jgi:hypothetical protein
MAVAANASGGAASYPVAETSDGTAYGGQFLFACFAPFFKVNQRRKI